jgi:hypothetical protein
VIERPNLRIYCSECELDLTRNVFILTRSDYFCVKCFSNLDDFPPEYLVGRALRQSFTSSNWDLMDEVVLTTAFKLWGFGNWGQIKEYLDYNCSPFPLKEIEEHFERYYLHQDNFLPPFAELTDPRPRHTFAEMNQSRYSGNTQEGGLKRRDSKGEKKPIPSLRSISLFSSSQNIEADNGINRAEEGGDEMQADLEQQQRREKEKERRNECSILGYNIKRKEF